MIEWFVALQVGVAVIAGVLCLVLGLAGRVPSDLTMGAVALVELLLVVQLVMAIVAPALGNSPSGSLAEFYIYLISALLLPLAGGFWALIERNRWSTVILGGVCLYLFTVQNRLRRYQF